MNLAHFVYKQCSMPVVFHIHRQSELILLSTVFNLHLVGKSLPYGGTVPRSCCGHQQPSN